MGFLQRFRHNVQGASSAEYALILAICGVMIGAAALSLGANIRQAIGDKSTLFAARYQAAVAVASGGSGFAGGDKPASAGNSANAPGQTGNTPGQSGDTPANGAAPTGQSGNTPGGGKSNKP